MGRSSADDIAVARLMGAVNFAREQGMTREQVIGHLLAVTTRPDLLARAAGIMAGAAEREVGDFPWRIEGARLLVQAGADRGLLARWIAQGMDNVRRRWATGPVQRPDPVEVAERLAEMVDGL